MKTNDSKWDVSPALSEGNLNGAGSVPLNRVKTTQIAGNTRYVWATKPTLYFIGMSTGNSAIMRVFPRWAEHLKLGNVAIQGVDCSWHADPEVYRQVVECIRNDASAKGALVTTHKVDLLKACRDMFDYLDHHARLMGEISCISKRNGKLRGHAKDIISSGLSLEAFLPKGHWESTHGVVFCMGAGGSAIALTSYLLHPKHGANRPKRIILSNRSPARLAEAKEIHARIGQTIPIEYHHTPRPEDNDALLNCLQPHSLVVNATGLGKDAPGSPITDQGRFPENGFAWDFNYRGNLVFLDQARAQKEQQKLNIIDGWVYFIHGWTRVIAEVFDLEIPTAGPKFDELSTIAKQVRNGQT